MSVLAAVLMSWTGRDEKNAYYAFFPEVVLEFVAYADDLLDILELREDHPDDANVCLVGTHC